MRSKPLISVIVPIYNTGIYLQKCLQSLLCQTLQEIEIICADDGSTDNSLQILQDFAKADTRIKVISLNHRKQGCARNKGMEIAQGEYIGFVDSDDWVEETMFENLYKKAAETDSDITMCSFKVFDESNQTFINDTYMNLSTFPPSFFHRVFSPEETRDYLFKICVSPCNKIYKRSLIENNNIKFPKDLFFEDNIFFLDTYLSAKKVTLIPDCCYCYRKFSKTSTCFSNEKSKIDLIKIQRLKEKILRKHNCFDRLKYDFHYAKNGSLLHWFKRINDKKIRFLYAVLMFLESPSLISEPLNLLKKEVCLLLKLRSLKNKRIMFWGASIFLENFLSKYKINDINILGIIDADVNKKGKYLGRYEIFSPEDLDTLSPEEIIISVINFSYKNTTMIKHYIDENYKKNICLTRVS